MSSDLAPSSKKELRAQIVAIRRERLLALSAEDRAAHAERLADAVLADDKVQAAVSAGRPIASYLPLPSEPDTTVLHRKLLKQGVNVLVPECVTDDAGEPTLAWIQLAKTDSDVDSEPTTDERGMPIPDGKQIGIGAAGLRQHDCTIAIVPALAADASGGRLGKGAGYYDRLLADAAKNNSELTTIALVFVDELLDQVPMEPHDVPVVATIAVQTNAV